MANRKKLKWKYNRRNETYYCFNPPNGMGYSICSHKLIRSFELIMRINRYVTHDIQFGKLKDAKACAQLIHEG